MKKLMTIALILFSITSFSQVATKAAEKPKYQYTITISENDYSLFFEAIQNWKRLQMYDPLLKPEEKEQAFKNLDAYGKFMYERAKRDSVLIKSVVPPDSVKKVVPTPKNK